MRCLTKTITKNSLAKSDMPHWKTFISFWTQTSGLNNKLWLSLQEKCAGAENLNKKLVVPCLPTPKTVAELVKEGAVICHASHVGQCEANILDVCIPTMSVVLNLLSFVCQPDCNKDGVEHLKCCSSGKLFGQIKRVEWKPHIHGDTANNQSVFAIFWFMPPNDKRVLPWLRQCWDSLSIVPLWSSRRKTYKLPVAPWWNAGTLPVDYLTVLTHTSRRYY